MLFRFVRLLLACALCGFGAAASAELSDDAIVQFESFADDLVESVMHENRLPGVGLGLVSVDGLETFRGYGYANVEARRYVTRDTLFRVASLTKLMTSSMLIQRHHDGELDIDAPLEEFLPETARHAGSGARLGRITLRQLMTHRSGLPRSEQQLNGKQVSYHYPGTCERLLRQFGGFKPVAKPDSGYRYSNLGFVMLGMVLENLGGDRYERLLNRDVFRPLNMYDSAVAPGTAVSGRFAQPYFDNGRAIKRAQWTPDCFSAAYGVASTAGDLALFLADHMRKSANDELAALSWFPKRLSGGHDVMAHAGSLHGFRSWIGYSPEHELGVIIWTNRDHSIDVQGGELLDFILDQRAAPGSRAISDF